MDAAPMIPVDDPRIARARTALDGGDLDDLACLLREHPELATARIGDDSMSRTLLHVATDWPGRRPRVAEAIALLVAAGADPDARFAGPHTETALHWAASADDVPALDALLDAGADLEAPGAVLGGGSALADAVGFAQWQAADRLVERGARAELWQAAALGMAPTVQAALDGDPPPTSEELDNALWHASRGGRRAVAEMLLERGADPHRVGWVGMTAIDAAHHHALAHAGMATAPPAS